MSLSENRKSEIGNRKSPRRAFTLVELLVVIGIIGVLIGVLIPTIASVQNKAKETDSASLVASLAAACERYAVDFNGAYPGPISNGEIERGTQIAGNLPAVPTIAGYASTPYVGGANRVTMSENLYLGLMGGLRLDTRGTALLTDDVVVYDPTTLGQGPAVLNPLAVSKKPPYYNANNDWSLKDNGGSKTGRFSDLAGTANDTIIPEFVDRFGSPMPVLYFRARRSVATVAAGAPGISTDNPVITVNGVGSAPYDVNQNIAYLGTGIGEGRSLKPADIKNSSATPLLPHGLRDVTPTAGVPVIDKTQGYPFNAYAYFYDKSSGTGLGARAKQREGFILISAGRDRVYGTDDDIVSGNFGRVGQ